MRTTRIMVLGLLTAVALQPLQGWGAPPDLTVDQTTGVVESKFFYLGPTGMKGWMYWSDVTLTSEARQILVTEVRAGTPAVGKLQYHDVILGIGGNLFTRDARVAFVDAVNDSEATGTGGKLYLTVFTPSIAATNAAVATNVVMVQLQEMGTISEATTPYNCPKADAVLSNYCAYVYTKNAPQGSPTVEPSLWAMLASGIPKYVDWACTYITNQSYASRTDLNVYRDTDQKVWYTGYQLVTLCQYYLLTTNSFVLPAIADTANFIAQGQDNHGLWGHTMAWPADNGGQLHGTLPGYGALNQAGLVGLYGMVLAQKCGVRDPEVDTAVVRAAHFFRSHMYIGAIDYGFRPPVISVTDQNGRMGIAAHVFRALGDPEAAKWFAMMTSTYGWRDWGHTGNEFNHCWGPMAAGIGGPALANFVHTNEDYYRVSLTVRRQPEGWFQSQGEPGGRGAGRSGHATGGYGVQLAASRRVIEITGAGYNTNTYWLTEQEMDDVVFAQRYESKTTSTEGLSTEELLDNLDLFCPKVALKVADSLAPRAATNAALRATLVAIIEDAGALPHKRVAALKALGANNSLVQATTDTWFHPSSGYVLNWGAVNAAYAGNVQAWTNVLASITLFDKSVGMDMLTASTYSQKINTMNLGLLDTAGSNIYYQAAATILHPDCGGQWWVDTQNVKNWNPLTIARYADAILRTAEQKAMPYDAIPILENNQIGEGLHSVMERSTAYAPFYPTITRSYVDGYGTNWSPFLDYTLALKSYSAQSQQYIDTSKHIAEFDIKTPKPAIQWFRNLIDTNIENTLKNPATRLADLRYNMTVNEDDDLFNAVCLSKIVAHTGNADPFVDIVNSVGFTAPIVNTHWRLYRGAVELGIADTNTVARWLAALDEAEAVGNQTAMAGILHVLAGKAAPAALTEATTLLTHDNDVVAMAALDVIAKVGNKNQLLPVFENYLTNSTLVATSEDGLSYEVAYKNPYWFYANWDAVTNIVARDYAGCLALANQLAASFVNFTGNGSNVDRVPYRSLPRTQTLSVLNPSMPPMLAVQGFNNGIYGILGLFAADNANCQNALIQVVNKKTDPYYNRGHNFTACEASLKRFSVPEIVAIQNGPKTTFWNERGAMYYLFDRIVEEKMDAATTLSVFTMQNNKFLTTDSYYYGSSWQRELTYRRGVEEKDGWFFFSIQ